MKDASEIQSCTVACTHKESECNSFTAQANTLDIEVKNHLKHIEDLTRLVVDKSNDCTSRSSEFTGCSSEIHHLNEQIAQFESHVAYLRSCQEKTSVENTDINGRIVGESSKNSELTSIIRDIEIKIKAKEDQIIFLCNSINAARGCNASSLDNNSNMQAEMDGVSKHITVMSSQNKSLSVELDTFAAANEAMRLQLDRRHRVAEVMERNDHTISSS